MILVIDIEKTCWKPGVKPRDEESEIIEIGVARVTPSLEVISSPSIVIKPTRSKVSPFCTNLNGWTQAELDRTGIPYAQGIEKLTSYIRSFTPTAWASWTPMEWDDLCGTSGVFQNKGMPMLYFSIHTRVELFLKKEVSLAEAATEICGEFKGTPNRGRFDAGNVAKIISVLIKNHPKDRLVEDMKRLAFGG